MLHVDRTKVGMAWLEDYAYMATAIRERAIVGGIPSLAGDASEQSDWYLPFPESYTNGVIAAMLAGERTNHVVKMPLRRAGTVYPSTSDPLRQIGDLNSWIGNARWVGPNYWPEDGSAIQLKDGHFSVLDQYGDYSDTWKSSMRFPGTWTNHVPAWTTRRIAYVDELAMLAAVEVFPALQYAAHTDGTVLGPLAGTYVMAMDTAYAQIDGEGLETLNDAKDAAWGALSMDYSPHEPSSVPVPVLAYVSMSEGGAGNLGEPESPYAVGSASYTVVWPDGPLYFAPYVTVFGDRLLTVPPRYYAAEGGQSVVTQAWLACTLAIRDSSGLSWPQSATNPSVEQACAEWFSSMPLPMFGAPAATQWLLHAQSTQYVRTHVYLMPLVETSDEDPLYPLWRLDLGEPPTPPAMSGNPTRGSSAPYYEDAGFQISAYLHAIGILLKGDFETYPAALADFSGISAYDPREAP
jgi:hypothetical protein